MVAAMLRKALLALGPVAVLALGSFVACDDESTGANLGIGDFDAGMLDVLTPPVPGIDGAADDDAGAPPDGVTVSVTGDLVADVPVVFGDADGNVLETVLTGADGRATSRNPAIATVTAAQTRGLVHHATTWTGVKLGELLALRSLALPGTVGQYDVTVPYDPALQRTYVDYAGPCSGRGVAFTPSPLALELDCIGEAPTGILVQNTTVAGLPRFAFSKTGPTSPTDGGSAAVTVPAEYLAPSTTQLTIANFRSAGTMPASVASIFGGLLYTPPSSQVANATSASVALSYPTNFGQSLQARIALNPVRTNGVQEIVKRYAPGGSVALDQAQLLPAITSANGASLVDPLRPAFAWTADTAAADGGIVTQILDVSNAPRGSSFSWSFVVPPGATSVKAPALGADAFFPAGATVSATSGPVVQFFEGDAFDAASFRQQQGRFFAAFSPERPLAKSLPALAADGQQLRATTYVVTLAH